MTTTDVCAVCGAPISIVWDRAPEGDWYIVDVRGGPISIVWDRAPEGDWYIVDVRGGCCPRGFPAITHHTPTKGEA